MNIRDEVSVLIRRGRIIEESLRLGPNEVHAVITHPDGTIEDLGISKNLLTTNGRDLVAAGLGHATGTQGAATASSATSMTNSGAAWTTDQYKGWRVYMPVTGLTTPPVYGNISSNTNTVLTVDQWWTASDGTGTTPASTSGYLVLPQTIFRFIGLTTDTAAAAAGDTVLASEIATSGASRALGAYAHTAGQSTYTISKTFSITGTLTAIHKAGLFTGLSSGVMGFETVLSADATVANGDTLAVTWTVTLT